MSLRMDDMNQKGNSMKLSLQTVDYRLAKLEEVALQTAESLFLLQEMVTQSNLLTRQTSSEIEGESTDGDSYLERTSPPSVLFGPQSAPSKLGKRLRMNEDRLRPFTDYSQASGRKPFSRALTLGAKASAPEVSLVPSNFKIMRQQTMFTRQASVVSPPTSAQPAPPAENKRKPPSKAKVKSPKGSGPYLGSELYYRRRSKALSRLRTTGLTSKALKEEEEEPKSGRKRDSRVTFSDSPSIDESPQRKAFSLDAVDSLLTTQNSSSRSPEENGTSATSPTNTVGGGPAKTLSTSTTHITRQMSSPIPTKVPPRRRVITPPSTLPSQMVTSKPAGPSNVVPITPIVTPNRSDYTTITDEIDTAGIKYTSPTGSPQTPRRIFFGLDVNVDLYTKKGRPRKTAITEEAEQLKNAEESEHAEMELMIRKRMRQISLTESDSMSDIAKHIVQELEGADVKPVQEEPGYHSDEGDSTTRKVELPVTNLVKVNSEPLLTRIHEESSFTSSLDYGGASAPATTDGEGCDALKVEVAHKPHGVRPQLARARTVSDTPPDGDNWSVPVAFVWPGTSSSSRPKLSKMETQC